MTKQIVHNRKRLILTIFAALLLFAFIVGIRMTWNTVSSAIEPEHQHSGSDEPAQPDHSEPLNPVEEETKFRIVIDAGHGGKDPGATGSSGHYEKKYNLILAKRVLALLDNDPMFEAILTRSDDSFIELEKRAEIANAWNANALVSIHGNTFKSPAVSGTETLYFSDNSLPLATVLQQHVSAGLNLRDRGVRQSEFIILTSAHMPAVIVETGYLTNPDEENMLLSGEGLQLAAQSIYEGLREYFGQEALAANPDRENSQSVNKIYYNGSAKDGKQVALTFDDGPDQIVTPQILDILKQNDIKATFFLIGNRVQSHSEMVQRIVDEGHVIGNHSWSHSKFDELSMEKAMEEIEQTQGLLQQMIGYRPILFRPPYGALKQDKLDQIAAMNMAVVNWSVDTMDWMGITSSEIVELVREQIYPGGIVLQHAAGGTNSLDNTIEALEQLIPELRAGGYTFVTVPELLGLGDV